ncbi:MAG: transposase [Theionarchaea archaeon]|nr:transposase [Theionarchaea archaeon]
MVRYLHERREKNCVLGALSTDTFIHEIAEILNNDVFEPFVQVLIDQFERVVIVMDHTRYHISHQMQDFYRENSDCLYVEYFPSYSPELDSTEQVCRAIKKWLSVRFWRTKEELKDQLVQGFKEDFVMVPIYGHLLS